MLNIYAQEMIDKSKNIGWVLEPDAKKFFKSQGLDVPEGVLTASFETANQFRKQISGPVVIKAVSRQILHKTEHQAVVTGIESSSQLEKEMWRLLKLEGCDQVLVEQMIQGIEIIVGAKNDFQFGPVIVFGIGGTSVEIYKDTAIRMAPLNPGDVFSMVETLKAKDLIKGYRGSFGVNLEILTHLLVNFSYLIMELEENIASVDLNPIICTQDRCVIADARIVLNSY